MLKILSTFLLSSIISLTSLSAWAGYVCYTARHDINTHSTLYIKYIGCRMSYDSCYAQGLRHFGYYNSYNAMKRAYNRCVHSTPRFID